MDDPGQVTGDTFAPVSLTGESLALISVGSAMSTNS
jgi:hypothetical protein